MLSNSKWFWWTLILMVFAVGIVNSIRSQPSMGPYPSGGNGTGTGDSNIVAGNGIIVTTSGSNFIVSLTTPVAIANGGTGQSVQRTADTPAFVQMSVSGGGNPFDMTTAVSAFAGQLGISYANNFQDFIWASGGAGTGTNVWGYPINIPGGLGAVGYPPQAGYFLDDTNNPFSTQNTFFTIGMGPFASSFEAAWPTGYSGIINQPGWWFTDVNPYSGAGQIEIRGAFTNSIHGDLIGTNIDGVKVYVPQYGWAFIDIGDAYRPHNTDLGQFSQPMGYDEILDDETLPRYTSINAQRSGDTYNGQKPLWIIMPQDPGNANHTAVGVPFQTINVWSVFQTPFPWTFYANEDTGEVDITNGPTFTTNFTVLQGSKFIMDNGIFTEASAGFNVNTNAIFNARTGSTIAWSFDGDFSHRVAFVSKFGFFPGLYAAQGAPLNLGHMAVTDLQTITGSTRQTNELFSDPMGNIGITNNLNVAGNTSSGTYSGLPYRAGQQVIGNLSTSQAVTFTSSLPSSSYSVSLTADGTLAGAVGFGATTKTASGFTITLSAGIAGGVTVDYIVWLNQ